MNFPSLSIEEQWLGNLPLSLTLVCVLLRWFACPSKRGRGWLCGIREGRSAQVCWLTWTYVSATGLSPYAEPLTLLPGEVPPAQADEVSLDPACLGRPSVG